MSSMKHLYNVNDTIFGQGYRVKSIKAFSPSASTAIEEYLKKRPHEIYGSSAQFSWGSRNQREPGDLDIATRYPTKDAKALSAILNKHGYKTVHRTIPQFKSAKVEMWKNGKWVTLIDIQPLEIHQSERRDYTNATAVRPKRDSKTGLYVQTPNDQLRRKHSAILNKNMPEHRKKKDSHDFVALVNDLKVSEDVKKDARLMRNQYSFEDVMSSPWRSEGAWVIAERLEYEKGLENHSLNPATKNPITQTERKKIVRFMADNPHINPDDINITKTGEIYVENRSRQNTKSTNTRGRRIK